MKNTTTNNITKTYFKTASAKERQFIARFTDCPTDTIKDVVAYAGKHLDECIALHNEFLLIARSNANAKKAEKEIETKAEARTKALEALNKKADEAKAGETAAPKTRTPKTEKPKKEKTEKPKKEKTVEPITYVDVDIETIDKTDDLTSLIALVEGMGFTYKQSEADVKKSRIWVVAKAAICQVIYSKKNKGVYQIKSNTQFEGSIYHEGWANKYAQNELTLANVKAVISNICDIKGGVKNA